MTPVKSGAASVGLFLAHALDLENEAAERYEDLADSMTAHNNAEVAALFLKLAEYSHKHAAEVKAHADTIGGVPHIAPWEFTWPTAEAPESAAFEKAHYLMRPRQALEMALAGEEQGWNYYRSVANETSDSEVKRLASQFAEEESEHVELVKQWLEKFPKPPEGWDEDPDPPHFSE